MWVRSMLALVLLLVGAAATWWNIMWGISPASLEGAWLWPLAVVPLSLGVVVWRSAINARRDRRPARSARPYATEG